MSLWLSEWRKPSLQSLPVNHKLAQGLNSTLALMEADEQGCDEALLLSANGSLCEAASGNLFWISCEQLYTPSLATGCLNGSTRAALMRLYDGEVNEVDIEPDFIKGADAVFITNCNWGIMPVSSLSPKKWYWQTDHPLVQKLANAYQKDIETYVETHAASWR